MHLKVPPKRRATALNPHQKIKTKKAAGEKESKNGLVILA